MIRKKMVDYADHRTGFFPPQKIVIKLNIQDISLFRNRFFLHQKYVKEGLSAREIAKQIGCGHSTINEALDRFKIKKNPGTSIVPLNKRHNCRA